MRDVSARKHVIRVSLRSPVISQCNGFNSVFLPIDVDQFDCLSYQLVSCGTKFGNLNSRYFARDK